VARPLLVLADRPGSRWAANVLAGAVEDRFEDGADVRYAAGANAIAAAIEDPLRCGRPVVVGWPFLSSGAADAARELAAVRARVRGAVLHVAGGAHPTAAPEATLRAGFDVVVPGEGERALLALLGRVARGEDPRAGRGLAVLRDGRLARTGREEPVVLDEHPPFSAQRGRAGPIEITRGCVWACRYCQTATLHRARFRHRSPDAVARGAAALARRGMRDVRFVTPSALSYGAEGAEVRLEAVRELLERVRGAAGPDARIFLGTFPSEIRPEHASPEALALLRRHVANEALSIGAQSGSDRVLAAVRRGHRAEDVLRAVRLAIEAGFVPEVDVILGLPGEEEDDREATRRLVRACAERGARVRAHAFMPLPGTPLADAQAGAVDPRTAAIVEELASRGAARGQWKKQGRWTPPPAR
jgi:B12-binding domain/radical SAM domain protein